MHFIMYVLETCDCFLPILFIKPEHNNYLKLNSTVVEGRIKVCDQDECFNLLSLDEWGWGVTGIRQPFYETQKSFPRMPPRLLAVCLDVILDSAVAFQMMQTLF